MKKRLLVLMAILMPVMLLAQPMDTTHIYWEDFEGNPIKMSVTYSYSPSGDWRLVGQDISYENWNNMPLYQSPTHSFHSPVYSSSGSSQAYTDAIPLSSPGLNVQYVYIDFDHICKVNNLDKATLYYEVAQGTDEFGNLNWSSPRLLNFANTSPFYYGSAQNVSNGALSDNMYSIWNSNNINAVPNNNTWWRHEMFDLSSQIFIEGTNPTHFRFQWRLNKTSPSSSGTENCAGWYIDNISVILSNCELIPPKITMQSPYYYNVNGFVNDVGPYTIKAKLFDNDSIAEDLIQFSYEINSGPTVIVPNQSPFTSNVLNANGHTIMAQWELPSICYQDTIYYHIYLEDTHGSNTRFDTFLVAHHNYTNIHQNDIRIDSLNSMPHCLITNTPQDVEVFFTNRSDAVNSPNTSTMTSGTFTMEVRDENGVLFHDTTFTWSGDICFDNSSSLSLGSFIAHHGYNYVTVYVNTRNGQVDGYHANDTIRITPYSCDSLLRGNYTVGGANPDFADINAVKEALELCGLGGPAVFHLRPGTYTDFDFVNKNYIGQSAENTITFQGDDVNTVIVTNNHTDAGTNTYGAVTLENVKDYCFKNLTIQGDESATASRGVLLRGNGSTNILFDGCKITAHNTHSTAITSCAVSRTLAVPNGNNANPTNPDTVILRNCTLIGGNFGVHYIGSTGKRNFVTIDSCDITSCYRGVNTSYTNGPITNNHIKQVSSTNPQNFTGVYANYPVGTDINNNTVDSVVKLEYGIYLGNAANSADFYVRNNRVHVGNGTVGIHLASSSSTNNITGYLYNNEVILYPVTAAQSYAMQIASSNGLRIINNSLLAKSDAPYSNTAALYISNGNNTTYLYNNILLNQVVCSDQTDYPLYLNGSSKASGSYNDFHSSSGVVACRNNVPRNTIEELESITDLSITNSISYLPPFTNITQSLLPTSFNGLECWRDNAVLTDIRGVNRSEVTHIGAYGDEIPAIDAALTALVSPVLGECPQPSYDIAIEITNKGAQTINFANNPAVIHLHSSTLNLDQDFNVNTGAITVLSSMNKVLSQNVTMPVNQAVDFLITITTSGDSNHGNDTLIQMFTMEAIIPDYEENFSHGAQQTWTIQQISGNGNWIFQEGTGENPTIVPDYGTGRLFFNSKLFNNAVSRAILPVVILTGSVNPILELWFAHDNAASNKNDAVTVKISTDGGTTYTNLISQEQPDAAPIKRYKNVNTPDWYLYTFNLSDYISAGCVFIAFDVEGKGGNTINIDRIRVRNLYNNDVAVTKIYGAGENPTDYAMRDVVCATVRNEGILDQNNVQVYLNVTGANEQWQDTLTIPSLSSHINVLFDPNHPDRQNNIQITFPDHKYNIQEVKDVEVRVATDQSNNNNASHWRMVTTQDAATIADTTTNIQLLGDYTSIIRPCVRYKTNEDLAVKAVKYYYDQTYIVDPENGFRAFVSDAAGNILATSELIDFGSLQQGAWNTIPIQNFASTNTTGEFYVGLEMRAHGNYLAAQVETPLRDSTFYYLQNDNGIYTYVPQKSGRFMLGALVDTPYVHDVALLELVHPVSNCDLGHEQLKVRITNNGTTDIEPPIQLHYTINGGPVVTEAFSDTLHSHETTLFTFAGNYDFTNHLVNYDSNYTIRIWSDKLYQDRLTYNDTLGVVVVSRGKSPLPIAPDTVIVNYHTSSTLSAQLPASIPQGVIGWYTNAGYESWNLLGYSPTYTTPIIYFDTTYYVTANPGTVDEPTVGTGTASGTGSFEFTKGYSRGRTIYLEQEVGHGTITKFAYNVKTPMNANTTDGIPMKIYMKCTDDNVFSTQTVNWEDEISGATLVVDDRVYFDQAGWFYFDMLTPFDFNRGNLVVFTETNCADYCTGTGNNQCNNCGQYVTGATNINNVAFNCTSSTLCQRKYRNPNSQWNSYGSTNRPNTRFMVANLECGSEKVPIHLHVPDIPDYDVETQALLYPSTSCALYDEHIKVRLKNMLNTPIPANKVMVHAVFNGTEITHTVAEPFAPEDTMIVEFTTPFDFSAPTTNTIFQYTIYTTLINEATIYTGNDTITGSFTSNYTAYLPDSIVYTGNYTQPDTILKVADRPSNIGKYLFYNSETATNVLNPNTPKFLAIAPLYDTAVYWMEGITGNNNNGCHTKRIKVIVNVFRPQYDFSTDELLYPVSYQCANSLSPNLRVSVTNQDTTSNTQIPSGTFSLNAQFTGSANVSGSSVISDPVASLVQDTITYDSGLNLGSATQNRIYQYVIYTTPVDPGMPVYKLNDTIRGSMYFPALPNAPQPLTYTVPYGGTQTVTPGTSALNYYYFYENAADDQAMAEGGSFVTEPIYAPTTYYYSGRVESDGFNASVIPDPGTVANQDVTMFNFTNGYSYAKILYNRAEMGGVEGRIDSIYFQVSRADTNGLPIPMKFWLKDTTNVEKIGPASGIGTNINWPAETANATLVFDGELALDQEGWVGFAVQGGYDFNGQGLLLYAEHDCGGNGCVNEYGMHPIPRFTNKQYSNNNLKKVYTKAQNSPLAAVSNFTLSNYRVNTKFKMNYTCESPKAPITINTTVPQHDVGVVAITAPVEQNNNFTNQESVTVTLHNFGSQAASNFPVSYQLDNGTPVTQNYTGSLASGATNTMTFSTAADLTSVYFPTLFKAFTGLTSDTYHANDTITLWLSKEEPGLSRPLSSNTGAHITNVSIAALNNGPGGPYTNPTELTHNRYSDFTQTVAPVVLIKGQEYPLSVTHGFSGPTSKTVYKRAYIDFDRDGDLSDSIPVLSASSQPGDTNAITTQIVQIPTDAAEGLTRMRVICSSVALSNTNSPYGPYSGDGETEDYAVLLSAPMDVDLGIPAILHPVGEVCADTNAKIRVVVRNYGTEPQTLSMGNPVIITATVTGASSGTYIQTVESGTLIPNGEMTVTIPNVDLSVPGGSYNVSVELTYNGDQYLTNNTRSIDAVVSNQPVIQLPFKEDFYSSVDWEINGPANYRWSADWSGPSQHNSSGGGPKHDHTNAGTPQEQNGKYATVPAPTSNNLNKFTSLTSGCINMHYRDGYPSELTFYKYIANKSGDITMNVNAGSGSYYPPIATLSKVDGGQTGGNDEWNDTLLVLKTVDEVARLQFTMTHTSTIIDPSIDDINLIVGRPDMAVPSIITPLDGDILSIGSIVVPKIVLKNNGNSEVDSFDVSFRVGVGDDTVLVTEHVPLSLYRRSPLQPGDTIEYTSTNEFVVTALSNNAHRWEVRATVIIPHDKEWFNDQKTVMCHTNVSIEDYETENGVYLGQNEPNPAVLDTRIPYVVPEPGQVTLEVTNSAGQVIYTTTQDAETDTNYIDISTVNFANGVYYYTLRYKDTVLTKKMVVER